jgi:hypothetical protein
MVGMLVTNLELLKKESTDETNAKYSPWQMDLMKETLQHNMERTGGGCEDSRSYKSGIIGNYKN